MSRRLRKDRVAAAAAIALVPVILALGARSCAASRKTVGVTMSTAVPIETAASTTVSPTEPPTISHIDAPECSAAALYSVDEGRFLYTDRIDDRIAPASLTKLLTAATALEYMSPDDVLTAGTELYLVQPYSSLCGLEPGSTATLHEMLMGMLLASGNDAAYTVAVCTARRVCPDENFTDTEAVDYFCGLMNDLAGRIGMDNSHFTDPDGWDDEGHYTTVSDLIKLTEYVLNDPEISEIVATSTHTSQFISGEVFQWTNSDLLLSPYSDFCHPDAIGVKTGTTPYAGYCLIGGFRIGGRTYITVVTGCESDPDRYELTHKLIKERMDIP